MTIEEDLKRAERKLSDLNRQIKEASVQVENEINSAKAILSASIKTEVETRASDIETSLKKEFRQTYLPILYAAALLALAGLAVWGSFQIRDVNSSMSALYKDTVSARKDIEQSRKEIEEAREKLKNESTELAKARERVTILEREMIGIKNEFAGELQRFKSQSNSK